MRHFCRVKISPAEQHSAADHSYRPPSRHMRGNMPNVYPYYRHITGQPSALTNTSQRRKHSFASTHSPSSVQRGGFRRECNRHGAAAGGAHCNATAAIIAAAVVAASAAVHLLPSGDLWQLALLLARLT